MSDYKSLPKTKEVVQEIDMLAFENYTYKKDYRLKTWLNSALGMEAIAVFVAQGNPLHVENDTLGWDSTDILIFTLKEKWVHMTNSEWATISKVR